MSNDLWLLIGGIVLGAISAPLLLALGKALGGISVGFALTLMGVGPLMYQRTEEGWRLHLAPYKINCRLLVAVSPRRRDEPASKFIVEQFGGLVLLAGTVVAACLWQTDDLWWFRTGFVFALVFRGGEIALWKRQLWRIKHYRNQSWFEVYRARRLISTRAFPELDDDKGLLDLACTPFGPPRLLAMMRKFRADYYADREAWPEAWDDIQKAVGVFQRSEASCHFVYTSAAFIAAWGLRDREQAAAMWARVDTQYLSRSAVAFVQACVCFVDEKWEQALAAAEAAEQSLATDAWRHGKRGSERMKQVLRQIVADCQRHLTANVQV